LQKTFSATSQWLLSLALVKIKASTQKNISPPIRLATIVAVNSPAAASQNSTNASIGVLNCHRSRYNP
jgi:hypothetical protein